MLMNKFFDVQFYLKCFKVLYSELFRLLNCDNKCFYVYYISIPQVLNLFKKMPKTRWLSTRNNSEIGILAAKKISGFDSTFFLQNEHKSLKKYSLILTNNKSQQYHLRSRCQAESLLATLVAALENFTTSVNTSLASL